MGNEDDIRKLPLEAKAALVLSIAEAVEKSRDDLILAGLKSMFVNLVENLLQIEIVDEKSRH